MAAAHISPPARSAQIEWARQARRAAGRAPRLLEHFDRWRCAAAAGAAPRARLGVAVLHAGDELLEEVARLVLREAAGLDDAVEQLAAGRVLHADAQVRARQEHLLEADDVGVQQRAVVDQLALHVPAARARARACSPRPETSHLKPCYACLCVCGCACTVVTASMAILQMRATRRQLRCGCGACRRSAALQQAEPSEGLHTRERPAHTAG